MPELIRLQTPDFEFSVWANDISARAKVYQATVAKRANYVLEHAQSDGEPELESLEPSYKLRFAPAAELVDIAVIDEQSDNFALVNSLELDNRHAQADFSLSDSTSEKYSTLTLNAPVFFENTQYQFEWVFFGAVSDAHLLHRSQSVNEAFRFAPESKTQRGIIPARLTGTINTGNDVGWMRLPLSFELAGKTYIQHIAFEVLPTKMLLHQDLPAMYQAIDTVYPLWRFSLVEKTEQDAATTQQRGYFPLMWLANFAALRERFEQGLKVICAAPHSRLQPTVAHLKAVKLKGRLPHRLSEQVKQDFANSQYDKRYRIEKNQLSVDTPENRFIKMAVNHCKRQLAEFEIKLRVSNQVPERQRLSDSFLNELRSWQQPLQKVLNQSFLKEVGAYSGLKRESLVLQQKTGYSAVYRVWQELKFYLDVLGNQSSISMKSVAEIYEVWCFLCLKQILEENLGFDPPKQHAPKLFKGDLGELKLEKGDRGSFEFYRRLDGVKATLYHEKKYGRKTKEIRTFLLTHKPDIVLEVQLPDGQEFIWLFDAKYRIANIKTDLKNKFLGKPQEKEQEKWGRMSPEEKSQQNYHIVDGVPDDAINQMHRYRDALIRITDEQPAMAGKKSRPVFGAFALYPGYFDQSREINPYADAIEEVGIGAFALLPSQADRNYCGYQWLLEFLKAQIGTGLNVQASSANGAVYPESSLAERLYVQDAARIPYDGMHQVLYPDLTMTVALGLLKTRFSDCFEQFKNGSRRFYHMPVSTFTLKFEAHVIDEVRYLAIIPDHTIKHDISTIWPVRSVRFLVRSEIDVAITGKDSDSDQLYILFELGKAFSLRSTVLFQPDKTFRHSIKITTMRHLEQVAELADAQAVYQRAVL